MKKSILHFITFMSLLTGGGYLDATEKELKLILTQNNLSGFSVCGTDKDTDHSYLKTYASLLENFRDRSIDLLEIGVMYGGSAFLWHEYLPLAHLLLVDIAKGIHPAIASRLDQTRYEFLSMDAYQIKNVGFIANKYANGFDVIIEDGPHSLESQIFTLYNYTPFLKKGGVLIIEDIANEGNLEALKSTASRLGLTFEIYDLRSNKGRYDDILFVVRK